MIPDEKIAEWKTTLESVQKVMPVAAAAPRAAQDRFAADCVALAGLAVPALLDERERLKQDLAEALALLREAEWAGFGGEIVREGNSTTIETACPRCMHLNRAGHAPDCRLAALLARYPLRAGDSPEPAPSRET